MNNVLEREECIVLIKNKTGNLPFFFKIILARGIEGGIECVVVKEII